ncbi:hypothetical protein V1512DRAFT_249372 [Lipomyces arxii]|uniref:uncharacterized protein n=1 Tax=Lipomyces arxii TaxID=56418 RepID=UPI0034CD8582
MRSTPLDRAISSQSNLMLMSFTGIVVAAFTYVTFFGTVPNYVPPADRAVLDEDVEADEARAEEESSETERRERRRRRNGKRRAKE